MKIKGRVTRFGAVMHGSVTSPSRKEVKMLNTNKLRGRIAESGLTLGNFAKKIGISQNTLTSRLSGHSTFNLDEVDRICLALGISDDAEKMRIFLA